MEKLLKALREANIAAFKILDTETNAREIYYVLDKIETIRTAESHDTSVTIYVDIDGKRGSSNFTYLPYMGEDELRETIKENIYAASFALNPFYELPKPTDEKPAKLHSNFETRSLQEIAEEVGKTIFENASFEGGYLSATEISVKSKRQRIINSNGVDLSLDSYEGFVEVIPSFGPEENEVETYNSFTFSNFDKEFIAEKIKEAIALTKARFEAKPLSLEKPVKVIIEGEGVESIASFFYSDLDYSTAYTHMNLHEVGEPVQGDEVEGDRLNIDLLPEYEGLVASRYVDSDGVVLKPLTVIKDGVGVARHGSYTYGYYLGEKKPTGVLPVAYLHPGKKSFAEMAKEPYLRCVKFSSFQSERSSGYFGGEVRLGFYFDGEKEAPVTGFSIAGSLHELKGKLVLSKETYVDSFSVGLTSTGGFVGPKYIEVKGMSIL